MVGHWYIPADQWVPDEDERHPAHPEPTCTYNSTCQDAPDPGSIDGVCTYHRADTERYDDGEAWPR